MSTHKHVTVETHRSEASPERTLRALVAAPDAPECAEGTVAGMDDDRDALDVERFVGDRPA